MSLSRRAMLQQVAGAGAAAALGGAAAARGHVGEATHVVAKTLAGRVRGVRNAGVNVFKGIPYGADTAPYRFRPAPPPEAWKRTRDALEVGPACPQLHSTERASEDCLRLNLWTPGLRDGARRPVMVYIHGGEFSTGSGSSPLYEGTRLCRRGDVVVITLNHRLNAFGHLYLARLLGPAFAASGNVGLVDLVLALKWVRDHAEEFGGDPECVTVFGQSGGGAKIATLMAMPGARGLFHRAATMSGQQITASGPRGATARARALLDDLEISAAALLDPKATACERLIEATRAKDPALAGRALYFGPVMDGEDLPRHPFYPDAPPQSAHIPMIIGNTRDETRAFLGDEPGIHSLTWAALPERLLPQLFVDISPEYVIAEYRRMYPDYSPSEVFFAATTAGRSWRAAIIELELRAAQGGAPSYAYQLDYRSPIEGGRYGAMHTMDIPLVFDNISAPGSLTGSDEAAQKTADQMSDAFIAFARHGRAPWQSYDLAKRATMVFDSSSHEEDDPRGGERRIFARVPYIQRGTY